MNDVEDAGGNMLLTGFCKWTNALVERMNLTAERFHVIDRMAELALSGPNGVTWSRNELADLSVDVEAYGVLLLDLLPAY